MNAPINPVYFYVFDSDSLKGFDEDAARRAMLSEHFFGSEFKYMMYRQKRNYINDKFGLWAKTTARKIIWDQARPSAVPACVTKILRAAQQQLPSLLSDQITGWTVTRGTHGAGSDACNLLSCCPLQPSESAVITAPSTGYIDANIGAGYPIFSVFGTNPGRLLLMLPTRRFHKVYPAQTFSD